MKDFKRFTLLKHLLIFLLITGVTLVCGTAMGQGDEEFLLEEIVVTGSRIARNNNESVSPIVTVDEKLFKESSTMAIETQLNKLPQFTPTIDVPQIGGYDIQPTARNTPGEATVALRGLGANRSLVLINGRRGTPSNATGVIDINTIPTAAIQYVEAISGGASSTYGADAMAGVINFIMKENFEGFELDAQAGITQEGDNFEYMVSGVLGANVPDNRGNIMMAFSYNERNEAMQRDREWFRDNWRNPSIGGTMFFPPYTGFNVWYGPNMPAVAALNAVLDGATFTNSPAGAAYYYDPASGQAFTGFTTDTIPGIPSAEDAGLIDGYTVKYLNSGALGHNNTESYLIYPLERYNFYTKGNYEINDYIGVFGQAYLSKTHATTTQEPGIITAGWGVSIDPDVNRAVIPADLLAILDSRPTPGANFNLLALLPFNRDGITDTLTFNIVTGLEGKIPVIDWTWEAFVSHGEAETTSQMKGFWSLERTRAVMNYVGIDSDGDGVADTSNFGEGFYYKGNQTDPMSPGFGIVAATCTSGLNPFDWDSVTPDCWEAVKADVKSKMVMEQNIWEANAQGPIAELPAGEMRGALGLSYRENEYTFLSDTINSAGVSFTDQILGLYQSADSYGKIEVNEQYAELLVPVLKDLPLAKQVNVELGGRRSDYNTTGVSYTYKAQVDWRTNNYLRFRGGYNRAERAPNIAELYLAPENTFGFSAYGDVFSMRNGAAWSANPLRNPNWVDAVTLAGQKMEAVALNADDEFFGADYRDIVTWATAHPNLTAEGCSDPATCTAEQIAAIASPNNIYGADPDGDGITANGAPITEAQWNQMPGAGFSYMWPITRGNPNLTPETADTFTIGFVLDSPIEDIPALSQWRVSVDYYRIKVKDAIGEQSADIVMRQCIDPQFNPTFDPNSPYCAGVVRAVQGGLQIIERTFFNNGRFETSGIDLSVNWGMDLGPGRLNVNSLLNYLMSVESAELEVLDTVDYTGTAGPSQNGLNGQSFEWKLTTTATYAFSDWDVSLNWRRTSRLQPAAAATGPVTTSSLPAYNMFDLLGNYQLTDNVRLRFGCENIFNKKPPLTGIDNTVTNGMTGGAFDSYNTDTNGRRFYAGVRVFF